LKWKMLPRRRHSIQTVTGEDSSKSPLKEEQATDDEIPSTENVKVNRNRRPSLAESIQHMTKSMSNSFQKAFGSDRLLYDDKNKLNKNFLKEVFSLHYNQPDLKVTKLNIKCLNEVDCVQHYPTSTVTDLLMNSEQLPEIRRRNSAKNGRTDHSGTNQILPAAAASSLESQSPQTSEGDLVDPKSLYYGAIYEVEVWLKYTGAKGTVRRKLDLVAKCHPKKEIVDQDWLMPGVSEEDCIETQNEDTDQNDSSGKPLTSSHERLFEADRDYVGHETIVQDMCSYLRKKGKHNPEEYLSLPVRFRTDHTTRTIPLTDVNETKVAILEESGIEAEMESFYKNLFLIQDLYASGYRMADVGPDENGLDFTHSLLATAKLATFHAVSYCMREDEDLDFLAKYPFLNEDPVYRPATKKLFTRAQNSLAKRMHNIFLQQNESPTGVHLKAEQSRYFEDAVGNLFDYQSGFVDPNKTGDKNGNKKFNVLCHGDLWMQNVVFSYGSCLESQSDVVDVRFDDLHHARYASCATDIHNLLYYTVDADIRRDHTVNLLAVYHDHFSKTVKALSPGLTVFSQSELLMEFHRLLPFGFLEGLTLFSTAYETQMRKKEAETKKIEALNPQDSTWSGSSVKVAGPKYSDYRDTVLSLVADVSRLKFHGVIPGAPVGINRNLEQQPLINKQCSEQMKNQSNTEKVLVTPL